MFNLLLNDIIIKIFEIRCNDIENDIIKLETKNNKIISITTNLTIEYNDYYYDDPVYQMRFNININYVQYVGYKYLYDVIHKGLVIFVYGTLIRDTTGKFRYKIFKSKIYDHPTSLIHIDYVSSFIDKYDNHRFFEGNLFLTNKSLKDYKIKPKKGICYIESIIGS